MSKKTTKVTKTTKRKKMPKEKNCQYSVKSALCHPSIWLIAVLGVALIVICGISAYGIARLTPQGQLNTAKLAIFDNLIEEHVKNQEISSDKSTVSEATGYGISDEDGVFYVTFDYANYDTGEDQMPQFGELKHGIMYFWEDKERGTYSNAFSYHDDYYHPGGVYVEIGNHNLRTQLAPDGSWRNL